MADTPSGTPDSPLYPRCGYKEHAHDDRGQRVKPFRYAQLAQHIDRGTRRYKALKIRLGRVLYRSHRPVPGRPISPQSVIYLSTIMLMLGMIVGLKVSRIPFEPFTPLFGVFIGAAAWLAWKTKQGDSDTITAMTLVAEGICGNCGFSLEGLETENDACLLCPECGAAWNALRITRPLWEPSGEDSRKPKRDHRPDIRAAFRLRAARRWTPDDCARCVHTPHHRFKKLTPEVLGQQDQAGWQAITRVLRQRGRVIRGLALLTGCVGALTGFLTLALPELENSAFAGIFLSLLMLLVLGIAIGVWMSELGIPPHLVASTLTTHGRCGSCANDLTSTPANANAMRVCQRCRASWMDSRFPERQQDHPVSPSTPPAS